MSWVEKKRPVDRRAEKTRKAWAGEKFPHFIFTKGLYRGDGISAMSDM